MVSEGDKYQMSGLGIAQYGLGPTEDTREIEVKRERRGSVLKEVT